MAADVDRIGIEYFFQADKAIASMDRLSTSVSGLQGLNNQIKASTVAIGTFIGNIATKAFSGIMGMANDLVNGVLGAMPFINESIAAMKDVIFRNIAWPIAQFVLPYLLQMSVWVRNNRALFVQMGAFVVSILRAIGATVNWLVGMAKALFGDLMEAVFGKGGLTFSKFLDLMNLALLKIAFVVTFLEILLEPIIKGLGQSFAWLWTNAVEPFLEGLKDGFGDYFQSIGQTITAIIHLADKIKLLFGHVDKGGKGLILMRDVFRFLGKLVIAPIIFQFKVLATLIEGITFAIDAISSAISAVSSGASKLWAYIKKALAPLTNIGDSIFDSIVSGFKRAIDYIKHIPEGRFLTRLIGAGEEGSEKPGSVITPSQALASSTVNNPTQQNITINNQIDVHGMKSEELQKFLVTTTDRSLRDQIQAELARRGAK